MLINPNENKVFNLDSLKEIYLAGGCFWGVEAYMKRIEGIYKTCCGYANGNTKNPTYEEVCKKNTGHAETVKVLYDTSIISLNEILNEFFAIIDPTTLDRQAGDTGNQYRSGIYYVDIADKHIIHNALVKLQTEYIEPVVTENEKLSCFYEAEEYHQDYLDKNPDGYCHVDLSRFKKKKP